MLSQVVSENFGNKSKMVWASNYKIRISNLEIRNNCELPKFK
jgi:hypothetical protein